MSEVEESGPLQISEQDDRKYRHITLPNKMQVRTKPMTTPSTIVRISGRLSEGAVSIKATANVATTPDFLCGCAFLRGFRRCMLKAGVAEREKETQLKRIFNTETQKSLTADQQHTGCCLAAGLGSGVVLETS